MKNQNTDSPGSTSTVTLAITPTALATSITQTKVLSDPASPVHLSIHVTTHVFSSSNDT